MIIQLIYACKPSCPTSPPHLAVSDPLVLRTPCCDEAAGGGGGAGGRSVLRADG